jgi:uracil-DNA glycosylase
MPSSEQLHSINTFWARKNTCALKETATQPVFGEGNPHTDIVFIGEAPGKNEDLKGVPFIGAAGTFLSTMLESIGLARTDIYITNVVKYRPPNNRDPLPREIDACKEWLHAELSAIQPKLIVFLGRHAMNHFFPKEKISTAHGMVLMGHFEGIPTTHFLPLYHPAAALYNGSMRATLMKDFKKIPRVLKKIA